MAFLQLIKQIARLLLNERSVLYCRVCECASSATACTCLQNERSIFYCRVCECATVLLLRLLALHMNWLKLYCRG